MGGVPGLGWLSKAKPIVRITVDPLVFASTESTAFGQGGPHGRTVFGSNPQKKARPFAIPPTGPMVHLLATHFCVDYKTETIIYATKF